MSNRTLPLDRVFKDPVHGYIHVDDPFILLLINARAFQRLRRIRQLGASYGTFHGAEHSRFTHSLGAYEVMRQITNHLARQGKWPGTDGGVGDEAATLRRLALAAALLHDVGHGPFSHAFEHALQMNHEQWTLMIILGDAEVRDVLQSVAPDLPDRLAAVLGKRAAPGDQLVQSLISSQLDADRMDYLQRDALATGVNYGKLELDRLVRVMTLSPDGRVLIKEDGVHTVEQFILARYFMYAQVYFHPVTRAMEALLGVIFRRAKELARTGRLAHLPRLLRPVLLGDLAQEKPAEWLTRRELPAAEDERRRQQVEQYLAIDEAVVLAAFAEWEYEDDPILPDLVTRFLNRRRFDYVELAQEPDPGALEEVRQEMGRAGLDPDYYLVPDKVVQGIYRSDQEDIWVEQGGLAAGGGAGARRPPLPMHQVSPLVQALAGMQRTSMRFYFPKDAVAQRPELACALQALACRP